MAYTDPVHKRTHRAVPRFNRREMAELEAFAELNWSDRANVVRAAIREKIEEAKQRGILSKERIDRFEQDLIRMEKAKNDEELCNVVPMPTPSRL